MTLRSQTTAVGVERREPSGGARHRAGQLGRPALRSVSNRRILVVDDNRDAASTMSLLLTMLGNHVQVAHDGELALELADDFCPELVLLDIGLPKLNGYEVARRIRQQPWAQNTTLMAVTGWGQE